MLRKLYATFYEIKPGSNGTEQPNHIMPLEMSDLSFESLDPEKGEMQEKVKERQVLTHPSFIPVPEKSLLWTQICQKKAVFVSLVQKCPWLAYIASLVLGFPDADKLAELSGGLVM